MTGASYFEIGGQVIELKADYDHATGKSTAQQRNVQRKMAKDISTVEKVPFMVTSDSNGSMGTFETIGRYAGLGAGVLFGVATFPVTQADSPLIGPADFAWFAATVKFTQKAQYVGQSVGSWID
ncbi:MAG: hypothetical protein [Circular genetic element sp.]|nr:MAG: hypothetical protein [Circular genetic element sp.]